MNVVPQISLIPPLRELAAHEEDVSFLSPDFCKILERADELERKHAQQPCHLERLYGGASLEAL